MRATLESIEQAIEMGLGKVTYGKLQHGQVIQLQDTKSGKILTVEVVDEDFIYDGKQTVEFSLWRDTDRGKEWVALIKGTDPKVYSIATKADQSRIIFSEAVHMVKQSPALSKFIHKRKTDMYMPITFSTMAPLASESKSLDGLNTHHF